MTEFEMFKFYIKDRFGFTHWDWSYTHDGIPWVSFSDDETYTFFYFNKDDDGFDECGSRRYSDHAEIETPAPMLKLLDDFKEMLRKEEQ